MATVTEASGHGSVGHTLADLDAHSTHSGAAVSNAGTGNTGTAEVKYIVLNFIIRT